MKTEQGGGIESRVRAALRVAPSVARLTLAGLLVLACTRAAALDPIVVLIGFTGPLTGPHAANGQDAANGAHMAIEDLNNRGVVIGGHPVVWRIEARDDQNDPKQALGIASRLVGSGVAAVIGPVTSTCARVAMPVYEAAGVPHVTPGATDPALAQHGDNTFFRMLADDTKFAAALADHANRDLHARRVALIDDRTSYGRGLTDAFAARLRRLGVPVVAREYTSDKTTQFDVAVTRIRAARPDVIFFGGMYAQAGPLLRQLDQLGVRARVLSGDGSCVRAVTALAGSSARNLDCAAAGLPVDTSAFGMAWKQRYVKRYGLDAFQEVAPYAYDAVMVVAEAMIRADSTEPKRFSARVRSIGYAGLTNGDIRFKPDGNLVDAHVTIYKFENGLRVPMQR